MSSGCRGPGYRGLQPFEPDHEVSSVFSCFSARSFSAAAVSRADGAVVEKRQLNLACWFAVVELAARRWRRSRASLPALRGARHASTRRGVASLLPAAWAGRHDWQMAESLASQLPAPASRWSVPPAGTPSGSPGLRWSRKRLCCARAAGPAPGSVTPAEARSTPAMSSTGSTKR